MGHCIVLKVLPEKRALVSKVTGMHGEASNPDATPGDGGGAPARLPPAHGQVLKSFEQRERESPKGLFGVSKDVSMRFHGAVA